MPCICGVVFWRRRKRTLLRVSKNCLRVGIVRSPFGIRTPSRHVELIRFFLDADTDVPLIQA
jgi:hypothetical protein